MEKFYSGQPRSIEEELIMQKADPKPEEYFQSQLNKYNNLLKEVLKKIRIVSILRIITFLITITGIYILVANGYGLLSIFFLTGIFVFIYLIKKHIALEKNRDRYKAYLQINQDEMDRVNGDTSEHKTGSQYAEPHHPFSEDLDVFGKNSLFQLLNRSATVNGQDLLAHLLNTPVFEIDILKKRQDAIRELLEKPDWRQEFQVTGLLFDEKNNDQQELINWGKKQHHNFNTTFYKVMILATPILGFGIIAMIQMGYLSFGAFLLFLILPLSFIGTKLGVLNKIHADVSNKSGLLIKYSKLFGHITAESYNSELLININRNITDNNKVDGLSAEYDCGDLSKHIFSLGYSSVN